MLCVMCSDSTIGCIKMHRVYCSGLIVDGSFASISIRQSCCVALAQSFLDDRAVTVHCFLYFDCLAPCWFKFVVNNRICVA